jgi:hypothetical protein
MARSWHRAAVGLVLCGLGCDLELLEPTRSCRELAERGAYPSDVYTLRPASGEVRLRCEMDLDGGGWTLVARSVAGGSEGDFGWTSRRGSIDDPSQPYSAGASALLPDAREIVVAAQSEEGTAEAPIFAAGLPADFFNACADSGCELGEPRVLSPDASCESDLYPGMIGNAGYASRSESFVFRDLFDDNDVDLTWGLYPDGYHLNFPDCPTSGNLDGRQGLLFIR